MMPDCSEGLPILSPRPLARTRPRPLLGSPGETTTVLRQGQWRSCSTREVGPPLLRESLVGPPRSWGRYPGRHPDGLGGTARRSRRRGRATRTEQCSSRRAPPRPLCDGDCRGSQGRAARARCATRPARRAMYSRRHALLDAAAGAASGDDDGAGEGESQQPADAVAPEPVGATAATLGGSSRAWLEGSGIEAAPEQGTRAARIPAAQPASTLTGDGASVVHVTEDATYLRPSAQS